MSTYVHCDRCGLEVLYPNDVDGAPMPQIMLKLVIPRERPIQTRLNDSHLLRLNGIHLCEPCADDVNSYIERGKP